MAGYVITVIGGKGGVGKSQVAANLACAYAAETNAKVLLMDFDQKAGGDQNFIMGIRGRKTVADLANFQGSLDARSLNQFLGTNNSGVSYLGMSAHSMDESPINAEGIGKALNNLPKIFPLTVIDGGSELTPLTLKALEFSTAIFLVTTPDILALNQTKRLFSQLNTLMFPREMVFLFLNQFAKGHPVSPDVVKKVVGKVVFSLLPRDEQSFIAALNKKKPLFLFNKGALFSREITKTVRELTHKGTLKSLLQLNKPNPTAIQKGLTSPEGAPRGLEESWTNLKSRIHIALVDEMDFKKQDDKDPNARIILREQTKKLIAELLNKEDTKAILHTRDDRSRIVKEILDEALGLGPLEDLIADKDCSEIMVVGADKIYFERGGKIKKSKINFTNERQVLNIIERIVAPIGRRIDEKTPYVDARLADGSRVHAIIPPCALDGCTITIRKFPENRLTYKDLIQSGSCTQKMADFLRIAVEAHRNIVVSGGTGSGKTTLINILGGFIQSNERIITCEDSAELDFPQEHVVRLETRPPSLEGEGEIDIRCLVRQTLRMRPDRIVVGECRGGETLDMLQAMGTGHDGSMTTVHSNSPRECIGRIETLVQYAGEDLAPKTIREMISNAVHLIIQQSRLDDGSRRMTHITELGGMQGDVVVLQDIFLFQQKGIEKGGKIMGEFQATGLIPKFIEALEKRGYNIPRGLFANERLHLKAVPSTPSLKSKPKSTSPTSRPITKSPMRKVKAK